MIVGLFYLSGWSHLETVNFLIRNFVGYVVFAVIVLFQADIRRALAHLGRAPFFRYFAKAESAEESIEELIVAAGLLSAKRIGAIIAIERQVGLRNYIEGGIPLDAVLTYDLLVEHLSAVVAAARRRGHRAGRSHCGGRVLPAADGQPEAEQGARFPSSRGHRAHRGERRRRDRRVGGNRASSRSSSTARSSAASIADALRVRLQSLVLQRRASRAKTRRRVRRKWPVASNHARDLALPALRA